MHQRAPSGQAAAPILRGPRQAPPAARSRDRPGEGASCVLTSRS